MCYIIVELRKAKQKPERAKVRKARALKKAKSQERKDGNDKGENPKGHEVGTQSRQSKKAQNAKADIEGNKRQKCESKIRLKEAADVTFLWSCRVDRSELTKRIEVLPMDEAMKTQYIGAEAHEIKAVR